MVGNVRSWGMADGRSCIGCRMAMDQTQAEIEEINAGTTDYNSTRK